MIQNFSITNFKCWDHLVLRDLKRVNIITGKNMSGKTALLDALALYQTGHPGSCPSALPIAPNMPHPAEIAQHIQGLYNDLHEPIALNDLEWKLPSELIRVYTFRQRYDQNAIDRKLAVATGNAPQPGLIVNGFYSNNHKMEGLKSILSSLLQRGVLGEKVHNYLLERFRLGYNPVTPYNPIKYPDQLSQGIIDIVEIAEAIIWLIGYKEAPNMLLIEGLGNNIHHSKVAPLIGIIQQYALEYDFQVFATTQSQDVVQCLGNLAGVSLIRMFCKEGKYDTIQFEGEALMSAVEVDIEMR